ncbi:MAG: hypothetical protein K2H09_08945, partial [Treponemataceae bacterium]|nr:hypothetical protein [Treponemataceae bacterium]
MDNKDIFINSYIDMISRKYHQSDDVQKNRNLAFEIFSIAVLLDKPFDEVYDTIQIKGGDGGFDGIYFEQLEDTASYVQHVFQCKNINTLKKNELSKFQSDYRSVFSEGNSARQLNIEGVLPSLDEYEEITASRCIIYPRLYFIFNGNKYDDKSANKALFDLFSKPNEFEIIDKNDLYERIAGNRRLPRKPVEFVFEAQKSSLSPREPQALYSYAIGNVRAANFRASATQICDLLKKENDTNGTDQYL